MNAIRRAIEDNETQVVEYKIPQETQRLATQDPLTGRYNRRYFMSLSNKELQRVARYKRPVSLMMIDIDYFKSFNDQHGHPAGDQLFCALVILCQRILRNVDVLARYGGEEFIVLLPETDEDAVFSSAERYGRKLRKWRYLRHREDDQLLSV